LVVDDDVDMVELLIGILNGAGYETFGAVTGGDALRVLEAESPDVVLLDLKMPGLHGVDVLRRLRMVPPDVPVIIVSGQADDELVRTTLKRGARDYLPKPVNPEHLLRVTAAALNRRT
jgi:DNA-binding response OmpR family regulator